MFPSEVCVWPFPEAQPRIRHTFTPLPPGNPTAGPVHLLCLWRGGSVFRLAQQTPPSAHKSGDSPERSPKAYPRAQSIRKPKINSLSHKVHSVTRQFRKCRSCVTAGPSFGWRNPTAVPGAAPSWAQGSAKNPATPAQQPFSLFFFFLESQNQTARVLGALCQPCFSFYSCLCTFELLPQPRASQQCYRFPHRRVAIKLLKSIIKICEL